MASRKSRLAHLAGLAAIWMAVSACIASTPMASASSPQVVYITATRDGGGGEVAPTPTFTLELTAGAAEAPPTMTAGQELSCVKGPHWALYAWVAKIAEGETVTLLARAPEEWADYYYVRKADGTECWAFGGSSVIAGDTSGLPEREAPPLPEITYTIENQTGLDVIDVFIRGQDETAWGADRLSADLHPGESFSLALTAGFYDVKIVDPASGVLYEKHDTPIGSDPSTNYTLLNLEMDWYIQNGTGADLCNFAFRRDGTTEWNMLRTVDDGPVHPGERATFHLLAATYAVAMTYCDGTALPLIGVYVGPASSGINFHT
jgi:hypothetical protein